MDHLLELREFFVEGTDHKKSHVLLHIAEPISRKERERGYFFVVAEINNGYEEQIEYLQQIIDDIESEYYDESADEDQTFEQILQSVNRRGHHVLKYENTDVSCVIGILREGTISLAYHGKPHALLFYPAKDSLASTKIITEPADGEQLFSELIEGNINPGDYVLVSTPYVTDYFTRDRMRKLLISRTTDQSAAHLQKVLHDLHNEMSFGGVIIHVTDKHDRPRTGKMPHTNDRGSAESLNKLMKSAKETEETLSPPLFGNLMESIKGRFGKEEPETTKVRNAKKRKHKQYRVETNHRKNEASGGAESFFGKFLIALGHGIVFVGTALSLVGRKIYGAVRYTFVTLFALITNKDSGRAKTVAHWQKGINNKKNFFKHLPTTSKIILSLTIILGASFLGSIGYLRYKENKLAEQQAYDNVVQAIVDKKDAAEAALVYNEKQRAFTLLQEAEALLQDLPQNDKKQTERAEKLQTELESFLQDLRNLRVVQPDLVADLLSTNDGILSHMERTNNSALVFGTEHDNIYSVQLASGNVSSNALDTVRFLTESGTNRDENTVYFLTKNQNLAQYDVDTKGVIPREIDFPTDSATIGAMTLYNGKLYSIDTTNAQVYKHNKTQTGYDKGTNWVTGNSLDLSDVQSATIDGNVFLGHENGAITRLFRGEKQSFEISGLDPQLETVTQLWTSSDTDTLYVLDNVSKRVVLLDKEGVFKKQFTANEWQSPMGMFVDEASGLVYVLDSNKLYKFPFN